MVEASPNEQVQSEGGEVEAALGQMPYGIYIVGTVRDGEPNGMIADWVMQVAFRPHRVAVSFENDSYSLASIRLNRTFTVNLLAKANGAGMAVARHFVQPHLAAKVRGRSRELASSTYQKLDAVDYSTTPTGLPLLAGTLMWLECVAEDFVDVGDHTIVIGHTVDGAVPVGDEPLTSADVPWPYSG
jgi:flavin reductase (DIM6/NTAB) family NADH-FMN oxidoreductase RutF